MREISGTEKENALLTSVAAVPGDDAPRLAYADWLDEQGGEKNRRHAELIRVQCQLARSEVRMPDLAQRAADLVEAVRPEMLGSLAEPASLTHRALELRRVCPGFAGDMMAALHPPDMHVEAVFRRGFLTELTLDVALFVLAADKLIGILPRPAITVTGAAAYLRALLECEHRWLVSAIHMQTVGDRFRVGMDHGWIRTVFENDKPWPRLTTLDLSSCSLGNGDARVVIDSRKLPALANLNFARNHLDRHLLRYFTRTPRWRTLCLLSWSANDCGHDGAEALLEAAEGRLQGLELVACGIGPEHQQRLIAKYGDRVRFEPGLAWP